MATYLLLWNPKGYPTQKLTDEIEESRSKESEAVRWNVASKRLRPGDRAFMMRVGSSQGVIGAGSIHSSPVRRPSWDPHKAAEGKTQLFVDVIFDQLAELPLIPLDELKRAPFSGYRWTPQASGFSIPDEIAAALERRWRDLVESPHDWLIKRALPVA